MTDIEIYCREGADTIASRFFALCRHGLWGQFDRSIWEWVLKGVMVVPIEQAIVLYLQSGRTLEDFFMDLLGEAE